MRLILACVLLALAACTADVAPRPDATGSVPAPTVAPAFEDLAATLFDAPPPGYVPVTDETRGLRLDDVVEGADDPEIERDRLERNGFERGFLRTWTSDDDSESVIYAFVYEFATAEGARADGAAGVAEARSDGDTFFQVPDVEGATGITKRPAPGEEAEHATFHAVLFVRGARYYLVAIGGPTGHSVDEAIELAKRMDAKARAS